jgi:hypothetical protein
LVVLRAVKPELDLGPTPKLFIREKEAPIEFSAVSAECIYLAVCVLAPQQALPVAPR